ncbi:YhbY family RNA-binding protein [Ruminococcaceae bacterium OttesenSCG-928-A16]|nr:YhbY family RNA-binding protein [Ruminococcaceae bacterium OttesenSCG-928-A16]
MLTSKQRAALRKAANGLSPVFQIGKEGVEQSLITATQSCLAKRELIKLRTLETSPETAREAANALAEATGAEVVQVIGGTMVLYLQKKKESAYADLLKAAGKTAR